MAILLGILCGVLLIVVASIGDDLINMLANWWYRGEQD